MAGADWSKLFDNYGIKTVTKTDKAKGAYVPNLSQRRAIEAAGIKPSNLRPAPGFRVTVLFDTTKAVESSYYHSERSDDAGRAPEPRMGHSIISSWLDEGDTVVIGNVGPQLFAAKLDPGVAPTDQAAAEELAKKADKDTILKRARAAKGKPAKQTVARQDFVRDPFVVAGALIRSGGECEMPGCASALFEKDDGTPYLEVHHVHPLGEGGEDTLANAAAVCPRCHREMHFGRARMERRNVLRDYIASLGKPLI